VGPEAHFEPEVLMQRVRRTWRKEEASYDGMPKSVRALPTWSIVPLAESESLGA